MERLHCSGVRATRLPSRTSRRSWSASELRSRPTGSYSYQSGLSVLYLRCSRSSCVQGCLLAKTSDRRPVFILRLHSDSSGLTSGVAEVTTSASFSQATFLQMLDDMQREGHDMEVGAELMRLRSTTAVRKLRLRLKQHQYQ